jgi:predicted aspartyl protease
MIPVRLCSLSLLSMLLALSAVACSDGQREGEQARTVRVTTTVPAPTTTAAEPADVVRLRVVSGPGGVFAFAKVYIRGQGPFAFTVDTGASHSVVDYDVVRKLRLETIGEPVTVTGITCRGEAGRLRMTKWRAGRIALPAAEIQTIDMPEPGGGLEIDGLLGSDVLSTFGKITVDYDAQRLLVGPTA